MLPNVLDNAYFQYYQHCLPRTTKSSIIPINTPHMLVENVRESSYTRGALQVLELGRPDAYFRLRIPPGLWYGFSCISHGPALLVNCADLPHDPSDGEILGMDNSLIPYSWVDLRNGASNL
jgi:dTDP-4-dehydrorhamnose 3,5-epimerase